MPDIATVAASVTVTLGVQAVYFLVMRFPDQMHRASTLLFELDVSENTNFLISKLALTESDKAADIYFAWDKHLETLTSSGVDTPGNKAAFLEQLNGLNSQLGRLKACISVYEVSGISDLVTVYISLFEQARLITKNVALNIDEKFNLPSSIADLRVLESQIPLLINRIRLESNSRDLQFQTRMEASQADTRDAQRRYVISSLFIAATVFVVQFPAIGWLTRHLTTHKLSANWITICVSLACALVVFFSQKYVSHEAMKNVKKLAERGKKRIEESNAVFRRYAEKFGDSSESEKDATLDT